MTRVCMCCGKSHGEKCPKCGAISQPLTLSTKERRYGCPAKRCTVNTFPPGDGGETHGVCDVCAVLSEAEQHEIVRARIELTPTEATAERNPECERNPLRTETGAGEPASPVSGSRRESGDRVIGSSGEVNRRHDTAIQGGARMIRIAIEMWPKGEASRARLLGEGFISRDGGSADAQAGSYDVRLMKSAEYATGKGTWKRGRVEGFPRLRLGPWDLLYRALRSTVGTRNLPETGGRQ